MQQMIFVFMLSVLSACATSSGEPSAKLSKYAGAGTEIYFRIQSQIEKNNELEMAFIQQWPMLSQCFERHAAADELDDMYLKATFMGFGRQGDFKALRIIELRPNTSDLKKCVISELEKIHITKTGVGPGSVEMSMQPLGSKTGPTLRFPYKNDERVLQK